MTTALITGADAAKTIRAEIDSARFFLRTCIFVATLPSASSHRAYRELWQAITGAPRHCQECQIIIAGGTPNSTQDITNRRVVTHLMGNGWKVWTKKGTKIAHAKVWVFDDERVIVGSHNLTSAAMLGNIEASIITDDRGTVEKTIKMLEATKAISHKVEV